MAENLSLYSAQVVDHFHNPRNAGGFADANGIGLESNPVCGDTLKLYLKIDGDHIESAHFETRGCPPAIAASSMLTVMLEGLTLEDALKIKNKDVAEALGGLPASKVHCSVLAEGALKKAVADYRKRSTAP